MRLEHFFMEHDSEEQELDEACDGEGVGPLGTHMQAQVGALHEGLGSSLATGPGLPLSYVRATARGVCSVSSHTFPQTWGRRGHLSDSHLVT